MLILFLSYFITTVRKEWFMIKWSRVRPHKKSNSAHLIKQYVFASLWNWKKMHDTKLPQFWLVFGLDNSLCTFVLYHPIYNLLIHRSNKYLIIRNEVKYFKLAIDCITLFFSRKKCFEVALLFTIRYISYTNTFGPDEFWCCNKILLDFLTNCKFWTFS